MNTIQTILSFARAGASSRAWDSYMAAGLDTNTDDPAALSLKGRLLKDKARKVSGEAAAKLFLQSAKAYADAAALKPDSYPLINAATMSLFAGQSAHAAFLAEKVLAMLDTSAGVGETPYWHEATRAEALFLLGEQTNAQAALDKAVLAAPAAWEDRAATLRQFRQIASFRNETYDWLGHYAPPVSLYFKGMIGLASDDLRAAEHARDAVANAGFGYGPLAAGADILVAEALVARGAELHVVLPVMPSVFRRQSVAPFGKAWLSRFDQLFEHADSVRIVGTGEALTRSAIQLAAQVAKGAANENARRIEGVATGLELNDHPSPAFDVRCEIFVSLERTAPSISVSLEAGHMHFTVVGDKVGDPQNWTPIADGFFLRRASCADALNELLLGLQRDEPEACRAIDISASDNNADWSSAQTARLLRLARCAPRGTTIANANTALSMLAQFPAMRVEPLGELPDAGGAIEIYAIQPVA